LNVEVNEETAYPKVSIIVTTLNNKPTIDECLRSITELDYPKQLVEVIVIDASSNDSTLDIVKTYPVKLISKPLNAPAAYNYASKIAGNEILGFIDADAKVEKKWLKKLVRHLGEERVAAVSGTIETWNKNQLIPRCIGYDLSYRYGRIHGSVRRVATMNLILRKKVMDEVGGFDENLPTQYDTDMGVRITSAEYKIVVDPNARCYHFHRPTLTAYFKQQFKYGQNTTKLYLKHSHLMRGDEITSWWMNMQPILYFTIAILLAIGFIDTFRPTVWLASLCVTAVIMLQYTFSALKASFKYRDLSALALIIIYVIRAVSWTLGGITAGIHLFLEKVRTK